MKKYIVILTAALLVVGSLTLTGCATIIKGSHTGIDIESDPSRAQVYVDGELIGETPLDVALRSNRSHVIEIKKEGFETKTYILNHHIGIGWVVLDLFFWPSLVVDAITGDWHTFDESVVSLDLEKKN